MDRLARVRDLLASEKLDALLISSAANRRYVSDFTGSAGFLLITPTAAKLITDGRYQTQAAQQAPRWQFELITPPKMPLADVLKQSFADRPRQRLGFEAANMSVAQHGVLSAALADVVEFVPTEGLIEGLREIKSAAEITLLERAVAITDAAFAAVRPLLRPTMREREVAWEIEKALREHGADGLAFEVIVAAGSNSALPHARPTDAELGWGQPIVLDFGALVAGYHGDMTRTVILGEADEQFLRIYQLVLEAQKRAAEGVRPGMTGNDADALARDHFRAAGYGSEFGHGLGHGVGLAIHEAPSLRATSEGKLLAHAVFSIEPGLYVPSWGGVRIEDLVLLEANGPRTLTQSAKDPVITWE